MRRSKRLRRRDARIDSDTSGSNIPLRKTYFDNLSEEALVNIVLHISEKPRHPDWQAYILPQNALQLYRRNSPLSSAAHRVLNTLALSPGGPTGERAKKKAIVLTRTNPDEPQLLIDILVAAGPAIHELKIYYPMHPTRWTISCVEHCQNLKKLSIHVDTPLPIESMLATWSRKLQSLSLVRRFLRKTEVGAMAKHCGELQKLDLRIVQATKGDLEKLWRTVGPTLTHLTLAVSSVQKSTGGRCLSDIARHCKSITSIQLQGWKEVDGRSVTDFCKQYGAQLQYLDLVLPFPEHDMSYLKSITTYCPNVLVDIDGYASQPSSMFQIFGSRLANLRVTIAPEQVSIPTDSCCNLVSVRLPAVRSVLASLFVQPKPHLRKLHLMDYSHNGNMRSGMQDSLDFLAENVKTIKSLTLDGVVPSATSLRSFALANRELQFVSLTTGFGNTTRCTTSAPGTPLVQGTQENWVNVINSIAVCPDLREVKLSCREWSYWHSNVTKVADACQQLRFRGVAVNVCGLQFL